jgi:hypothetical protein
MANRHSAGAQRDCSPARGFGRRVCSHFLAQEGALTAAAGSKRAGGEQQRGTYAQGTYISLQTV